LPRRFSLHFRLFRIDAAHTPFSASISHADTFQLISGCRHCRQPRLHFTSVTATILQADISLAIVDGFIAVFAIYLFH